MAEGHLSRGGQQTVCAWPNAGVVVPADHDRLCYFYMLIVDLGPLVLNHYSITQELFVHH
jgi:hypothetical protein